MSGKRMRWAARALAAALLAACGAAAPGPRDIVLGADACEYCRMAIDDPARAAEWIAGDGTVHTFDEPGCLLAWLEREGKSGGLAFLADEAGSGWVPAGEAVLVRGATETAMGFGLVAYRDRAEAEAAGGDVVAWKDLIDQGVAGAHVH